MKTFEKLVLNFLNSKLPLGLDPFQFASIANMSTKDAISINLHETYSVEITF